MKTQMTFRPWESRSHRTKVQGMLDVVAPTEAECRTILGFAYDEIQRRLAPLAKSVPPAPAHERPDAEEAEQSPVKKRRVSARLATK